MTNIDFNQIPQHVGMLTVVQVAFCFLSSVGIGASLALLPSTRCPQHRIPLCFVGLGLVMTGTGFLLGIVEVVKLGHIAENFGITLWAWVMLLRRQLRVIGGFDGILLMLTPLRKGMLSMKIKVKDGFGKFLGKLGGALRGAENETERELLENGAGRETSEEEDALDAAMGWNAAGKDSPGAIAGRHLSAALNKS